MQQINGKEVEVGWKRTSGKEEVSTGFVPSARATQFEGTQEYRHIKLAGK
jgi:hypothetical protein